MCLSVAISCVRRDDKSHHLTGVAVAFLSVVASGSRALHSRDPLPSVGCRQRRMVRIALDKDSQSSDPLCAVQGPAGRRSLSQAMSAAVATRFNKFSKVTYSQLSDHSHEIWKSLLVSLVLSSW